MPPVRDTRDTQIEYNHIVDHADTIYAEVLIYGEIISKQPAKFGFNEQGLITKLHNAGVLKSDLDDDKEGNEWLGGEKIYPDVPRVKARRCVSLENFFIENNIVNNS